MQGLGIYVTEGKLLYSLACLFCSNDESRQDGRASEGDGRHRDQARWAVQLADSSAWMASVEPSGTQCQFNGSCFVKVGVREM